MGKKLAKPPKEKIPASLEKYFRGSGPQATSFHSYGWPKRSASVSENNGSYFGHGTRRTSGLDTLSIPLSYGLKAGLLRSGIRSCYAGKYIEHYTRQKGGSDPMILFGPQAGRKGGVAPALLMYLPAYQFCGPDFVSVCTVEGYRIEGVKPTRKP